MFRYFYFAENFGAAKNFTKGFIPLFLSVWLIFFLALVSRWANSRVFFYQRRSRRPMCRLEFEIRDFSHCRWIFDKWSIFGIYCRYDNRDFGSTNCLLFAIEKREGEEDKIRVEMSGKFFKFCKVWRTDGEIPNTWRFFQVFYPYSDKIMEN